MFKVYEFNNHPKNRKVSEMTVSEIGDKLIGLLSDKFLEINKYERKLNSIGFESDDNDELILVLDFVAISDMIYVKVKYDGTETISALAEEVKNDIMDLYNAI